MAQHAPQIKDPYGLSALFNLAVTTKLKSVRVGDVDEVVISKIRILGEP